jgi:APA family basic amino acid/polyamine antiporter
VERVTRRREARQAPEHRPGTTRLVRELGTFGAVLMGLGAMIGTGVFVSLGLGSGIAGPAVLLALALAAGVALCNGLSSAQLAASHPVSGGTYEYGYRYLNSWAGFTAGWVFLVAKSASAATAALGFSGYILHALEQGTAYLVPLALVVVAVLTGVVLTGLRRSNAANVVIVAVTLAALVFFVFAGAPTIETNNLVPFFAVDGRRVGIAALLEATALMFVAYTGYARIATLGEEVRDPKRTIPRAIVLAAVLVMLLYGAVAVVGIGVAGSEGLRAATDEQAAPLAVVAQRFAIPGASALLTIGALTAMLGVLLNLILGLSRVVLAMARRGDLFAVLAAVNARGTTPYWAVLAIGALVAGIVAIGDLRTTWSFSAFSVLIYYALTNLAALRMPASEQRYPRFVAVIGLAACLGLAFWVDVEVWLAGLGLIALGLGWHAVARRRGTRQSS